jgi:FkbM family methyltransferase
VIEANLAANRVRNVDVVHGAIDYSGLETIEFRLSPDNLGSATLQEHERENPAIRDEIAKVPVCTLSGLIERSKIGNYSLVCDIEGAEAGMILGESEEVRSRCQLMLIELHDTGIHEGKQYRVEELAEKIEQLWGLRQVASNDRVFVFARSPALVH